MKTLYLIHHSHTDIGYTTAQANVRRNQIDFIRYVLDVFKQRGLHCGFKWVCESFWAVEQFLLEATDEEKLRFEEAVLAGSIGLSGNYANFSELLGYNAMSCLTARASAFGKEIGHPVDSAMNADINGFGWGYGKALINNGIKNLFTCIHTHHGMYPLQRHQPFWWVGPEGEKLLVWNGEHYHLGNELGLAPGAVSSYMIKDECDAQTIYHDPWKVAEFRIPRLFKQLDDDQYPYSFLPVMISGLRSDNAPPNTAIVDQVMRWNDAHGQEIAVEMVTLDHFFARLRQENSAIPSYQGDWPDWWTDGVASMPGATALFRRAQRNWETVNQLKMPHPASDRKLLDNLAMYAEHTYGHAASVVQPHDCGVLALAARKQAYAAVAEEESQVLMAAALACKGMAPHDPSLPLRYRVINPHPIPVNAVAHLPIEHHEYYEKFVYRGIQIVDESHGAPVSAGVYPTPVTTNILVPMTLEAGQEKVLTIHPTMTRNLTPDLCRPTLCIRESEKTSGVFETDAFSIAWSIPQGITAWIEKPSGRDLLRRDLKHAPFMPAYSVTPVGQGQDMGSVRGAFGLSRSGANAQWSDGIVIAVKEGRSGTSPGDPIDDHRQDKSIPMYQRLEFSIEVAGSAECSLTLEAIAGQGRVDATFKTNKQNIWAPENLYLSLPFGLNSQDTIWLDKSGGMVQARVDQLPGTLIDFYSVQGGFISESAAGCVAVAMRDNPLLQLGPLENQVKRKLHAPDEPHPDLALPYAWLMSNYWETNFAAGLGGFHAFRFSVETIELNESDKWAHKLRAANSGFVSFRIGDRNRSEDLI